MNLSSKLKDFFVSLSPLNKILVRATLALLVYGYLCRLGLYFFWESKTIGWVLFFITTIGIAQQLLRQKKAAGKNTTSEKIFTGIAVFILLIKMLLFFAFPQTNAYKAARQYLQTDAATANELGTVYDVFLMPVGGMAVSSGPGGQSGGAELNFIVKGSHKYKDVSLQLVKENNTEWTIISTK